MARDIYMPRNEKQKYSKEQINDVYKRFFNGFNNSKDHPEIEPLFAELDSYIKDLKALGISDEEVKNLNINFGKVFISYLWTMVMVLFNLSFSFAGLIILTSFGMLNRHLAEKARKKALASSTVKVVGIDVMASKKITSTIIMYPFISSGFTLFFYFMLSHFTENPFFWNATYSILFFFFFPVYGYICILARDNLLYYAKMTQAKFFVLFYTEHMFQIQQTRKNLKEKIVKIVEDLGKKTFKNFDKIRLIKAYTQEIEEQEKIHDQEQEDAFNEAFSVLTEIGL